MKIIDAETRPVKAWHDCGMIHVELSDGSVLEFPITLTPTLATAPPEALNQIELLPYTLHWPALDEDLTIESLKALVYGK